MEIVPVILSAAKDLHVAQERSFAALRMTGRTPLKCSHGKSYLQTSGSLLQNLLITQEYAILVLHFAVPHI